MPAESTHPEISVDLADHVATVEIHRPPHNFFDHALIRGLADVYEGLGAAGACRAIVLCSEGKNFCAGANFQAREDWGQERLDEQAAQLYVEAVRLFRAPLPVVAAVEGAAVGGGLGLAVSADFRVTGPGGRFAANFARLGIHQGFGLSHTLPRLIGESHANLMLFTGRRLKGAEAHAIGLADELVDDDARIRERAGALAAEIAAAAPLAVRAIRATQRAGIADAVARITEHELAVQSELRKSADFQEGVEATAARRVPAFHGR